MVMFQVCVFVAQWLKNKLVMFKMQKKKCRVAVVDLMVCLSNSSGWYDQWQDLLSMQE